MKPTDLNLAPLEGDLLRFEEILDKNVKSEHDLMNEMARYVVLAGGKRLRPALAIASSYGICGIEPTTEDVLIGACAVELVHAGSLHHDDVIDNATSRRGQQSINIEFSNTAAILSGDYLLSVASILAASLGTQVSTLLAQTIADLTIGQIVEQESLFDTNKTIDQYLKSIEGKTASLFSAACKVGCLVSGADQEQTETLSNYGYNIGMAFQIIDDVLDITSDDDTLGKKAGNDILEGVFTPPVIYALESGKLDPQLLHQDDLIDNHQEILEIVREHDVIKQTLELAVSYSLGADTEIEVLTSIRPESLDRTVVNSFQRIISDLLARSS